MAKKVGKAKSRKKTIKTFKQLGKVLKARKSSGARASGASSTGASGAKKKPGSVGEMIKAEIAKKQPQATRHLGEIKIGKRFRKDLGDVEGLARSIDDRGALIHPVVIQPDGKLIAGERRMAAWKICNLSQQGKLPIPVRIINVDALVAGEWDENRQRKDFTHSEAVAIAEALRPLEEKRARERQAHGETAPGKSAGPTLFGTPAKLDADKGRAADKVAAATGRDRKTLAKAEAVVKAAKQDPGKFGKLQEDMDRTNRVDGPFKRLQNMQASEKIRAEKSPLPGNGPYRGGIIDFPWPGDPDDPERTEGRGYYPYPTMTLEQLETFARDEVKPILHADCVVGLWIPNYHLARGDQVAIVKAMGLDPITIRTWNKPKFGYGQLLRGQTEQMIYATKGNPVVDGSSISTRLDAPAGKEHSEKPAQSYVDFERVVAAPRYFELFARRPMPPNWDGHGNQVGTLVDTGKAAKADIDPSKPLKVKTLLEALEEIEAGRAIVVTGKKITQQIKRYTTGPAKKPKLNKDGEEQLADLRREQEDYEKVLALRADMKELRDLYRAKLILFNEAMVASNMEQVLAIGHELHLIARAANKGAASDRMDGGHDLRVSTAAPIGEVPGWGQKGMFQLEVDGVPYIVSIAEYLDQLGSPQIYAVDPLKPCHLEAVGDYYDVEGPWFEPEYPRFGESFMSEMAPELMLGRSVVDYCRECILTLFKDKTWIGGRRRARKLALPESVYRMPASWGDGDLGPIEWRNAELEAVRPTDSMVKRGVTHAEIHSALFQIDLGQGVITNNKLADELLEQKLVAAKARMGFKLVKAGRARLETYVAMANAAAAANPEQQGLAAVQAEIDALRKSRTSWPAGHVVSMTIDHDKGEHVGTCACGFVARVPRDGATRCERLQRALEHDRLIDAHWVAVEASPNPPAQEGMFDGATAPAEPALDAGDPGPMPEFLKVKNRGKAKAAAA